MARSYATWLAAFIGRIPERAEEQGDVEVLRGAFHPEHDRHLRIKALCARQAKVRLRVERDAVRSAQQLLRGRKFSDGKLFSCAGDCVLPGGVQL